MATWRRLLELDEALLVRVVRWQRPAATRCLRAVTHLGDGLSWAFAGTMLWLAGVETAGRLVLLASGLAALMAQLVKRLSKRRRPSEGITGFSALVANPDAFSFPSGHTAAAVAVAVALSALPGPLGLFFAGFAVLVGFSRVYLGAHYPLDVAAGSLVGLLAGVATWWV